MDISKYIYDQFELAGIELHSLEVTHPFDERNFGNWCVVVACALGKLRITNDRGQIFLENFDQTLQTYIWSQSVYPSLMQIFKSMSNWHLSDLLNAITQHGTNTLSVPSTLP